MPDLWMDVDVALAEVPVNVMPLLDDTDFKTREVAVAYNAAGMDLVWNFVTSGGAFTQTAVTPTTSGNYDWTHQGDGMYTIEIPASVGASINNDTEGFGWFTGFVTGVLPWRGPTIGFRAAGLNDALIDSAYSATRGLAGTALPNAAAEAAGGLYTRGTGAGQINQDANGRIDANVAAMVDAVLTAAKIASDAITAVKIAADAFTAAKFAADVTNELQNGLATSANQTTINNNVLQAITDIGGVQTDANDIQTRIPTALTGDGNMKSDALRINGVATAAAQLAKSAPTIVSGAAITGTLSSTQATTDLTEATNDHYIGRALIWTSGVLQNLAVVITDYDGSTKMLTYDATPTGEAPSNTDTFIIV